MPDVQNIKYELKCPNNIFIPNTVFMPKYYNYARSPSNTVMYSQHAAYLPVEIFNARIFALHR